MEIINKVTSAPIPTEVAIYKLKSSSEFGYAMLEFSHEFVEIFFNEINKYITEFLILTRKRNALAQTHG
ncbi:protein of unknown function [Pseudodesulfovibrio piezophilus C1TLV30]|uniref:Uncharacterized protein n=1 Tax=Pseudodesulfovibrio piezophilus (strain DSM 21447 / JCM 15486 / C1TLV30) TaxID=1322246 RepID=M1WUU3_PSEP2|nr:protein of unknown function [Pseudodesulfovibrio piezophilus C1TLV30]